MHKQIEKYISELFGTAINKPGGKELYSELTDSAVSRYEEEIKNGRLPSEAYQLATGAIGDVDALLDSYRIKKRRYSVGFWLTAAAFFLAAAGFSAFALLHRAYVPLAIGLAALALCCATALILIKRSSDRRAPLKKAAKAIATAVIVVSAILFAYSFVFINVDHPIWNYDQSRWIDNIESVSIIRVTHPEEIVDGTYTDDFEYETLVEIDAAEWPDLLEKLGGLRFYQNNNHELLQYGDICVLIDYTGEPWPYFIYSSTCSARGGKDGPLYNCDYCDKDAFDEIVAPYLK